MHLADHILFLLLGIVLPVVLLVSGIRRRKAPSMRWTERMKIGLYYGNGLLLYAMALVVLLVYWFTGRSFTEVGLGWGQLPYDLTAVLLLAAFLLLYLVEIYRELGDADSQVATRREFIKLGFLPVSARQFMHFLFLAVAAGVGEEIVYRGFMITYLTELLGSAGWVIIVVLFAPAVAFGVGHLYQGWKAVVKIIFMAILFGFFFLRTHTLWPLILIHTAVDVFGGLISWYLLGREERSGE